MRRQLLLFIMFFAVTGVFAEKLSVSGSKVYNEDGDVITLKGVNLTGFEDNYTPWFSSSVYSVAQELSEEWKANVVRVGLNQSRYLENTESGEQYKQNLEELTTVMGLYGLYVMFDLHWLSDDDNPEEGSQSSLPDGNSSTFWSEMASQFDDHDNVIYDIFNEPISGDWTSQANSLMSTVKSVDSDAIFVIAGLDWGYDLSGIPDQINESNVIYDCHIYPWKAGSGGESSAAHYVGQYPILIGEFGYWNADTEPPANPKGDLGWVNNLLSWMDSQGSDVHYTAWSFDNHATPTLLESRGDMDRTDQGEAVYNNTRSSGLDKYIADRSDLTVENATYAGNTVTLTFNKPVDRSSAESANNYEIDVQSPQSASVSGNLDKTVILDFSSSFPSESSLSLNYSNIDDKYQYSTGVSGSITVEYGAPDLPLQVNISGNKGGAFPELGYVDDQMYEEGKAHGYELFGVNQGPDYEFESYDSVAKYDYVENNPQMDSIFSRIRGITAYRVVVPSDEYRVILLSYVRPRFANIGGQGERRSWFVFMEDEKQYYDLYDWDAGEYAEYSYLNIYDMVQEPYKAAFCTSYVQVSDGVLDIEFKDVTDETQNAREAVIAGVIVEKAESQVIAGEDNSKLNTKGINTEIAYKKNGVFNIRFAKPGVSKGIDVSAYLPDGTRLKRWNNLNLVNGKADLRLDNLVGNGMVIFRITRASGFQEVKKLMLIK